MGGGRLFSPFPVQRRGCPPGQGRGRSKAITQRDQGCLNKREPGIPLPVKCPFQQTCSRQLQGEKKIQDKRETAIGLACVFITCQTHISTMLRGSQSYPSGQSVHTRDQDNDYPNGKGGNWIHVQSEPDFQARELRCAEGMPPTGSSKPSPAPRGQHPSSTVVPATQRTWQCGHCWGRGDDARTQPPPQLVPEAGFSSPAE